jgi:APA family basic amino acid/polyamine antiporter
MDETGARATRALPGRFVLAVTVGGVIGLGILRGPGEIAAVVSDPGLYLALWFIGGLFVLLSTAVVAELLGMTPRSGGAYALIRHAYGPYPGFVIGWADWLSFAADLALKAVVIMEFVAILLPETQAWSRPLAILVTSVFAAIQLRGIGLSALIQEFVTSFIGLVIVGLSVLLFFVGGPHGGATELVTVDNTLRDWSLVIATIIFTYDGWLYASYFSGELKGGAGAAARACIKGMVIVIALYMLMNTLPAASSIIVIAAILILLGHQNLEYMGGPRVLQALAVDGFATRRARKIGKGGNPIFAINVTWVATVFLIWIGGFEFLLLLSVFFYVPIYLAMVVGVLILRKREPDSERPFRAWGHPYSTIVCLIGWIVITVFQAYAERETALYALAMVAVSWPVYRYLASR